MIFPMIDVSMSLEDFGNQNHYKTVILKIITNFEFLKSQSLQNIVILNMYHF